MAPPAEHARHWPHPVFAGSDLLHARYVTHAFGRHRHQQYTFAIVTAGAEDFDYRGTRLHAVPGTVALVDADTVHTGQPGIAGGWRYEVLYADVDLVRSVAPDAVLPSFPQGLVTDSQAVTALQRVHAAASTADRLAASEATRDAITLLVRRYGRPALLGTPPADLGARRVRESAALLRERLVDPPSVDELAELAGCSPFALIRAFRRHLGLPPHAYLTQCRIDRARALLSSGADVADTALAVGFADQAHLTRHFRRHIGVPRPASPASAGSFKNRFRRAPSVVDVVMVQEARGVIRDSLGVGFAVGAYGVAFGAASVAAGLSVLQTSLLSLAAFTGGTQFAVVGVVSGGGTLAAALSGGLLLGARNALYAMRLAPLLQVRGLRRLVAAHGTIDESTAMAVARRDPALSRVAFWWTFLGVYLFWNVATVVGAIGAQALGDPAKFGLDAVVPAAFLALLAPRLRSGAVERRVAFAAAVIAFALIPFTPPGVPVLACSAALLLAGVAR